MSLMSIEFVDSKVSYTCTLHEIDICRQLMSWIS